MDATSSADELLRVLFSDPAEALVGFRLDGAIFLWNQGAEALYGYREGEQLGKSARCLMPLYELRAFDELVSGTVGSISPAETALERLHKDGTILSVRVRRTMLRDPQGRPLGILERARDSSAELAHAVAAAHLQFLVEKLPLYFWATDRRLVITSHWGSKTSPNADFPANSSGQSIQKFLRCREASETPIKQHFLALRGTASRLEYASGDRLYDLSIDPYRSREGSVIGCIGVALDITDRRKSEDEIRYRATHDGLTGLANYREFVESLEQEVRRTGRTGQPFALLLLDLDDLKLINDRFGHLTGNLALKRLAGVMKQHCRGTELAARFGGDEFAILLLDADAEQAQKVADRIRDGLRLHPEAPTLSVSIGLSVYPQDGPTAANLLEAADKRLYQAKKLRHGGEPLRMEQHR
jgi:diguanylate cyclase (GGDEF)-like protein/PAS domain S-box-containing protein